MNKLTGIAIACLFVGIGAAPCNTYACPDNYRPKVNSMSLTCPNDDPMAPGVCLPFNVDNKFACCDANECDPDKSKYPGYTFGSAGCNTGSSCWPYGCDTPNYSGSPNIICETGKSLFTTSGCTATCLTFTCGDGYGPLVNPGAVNCPSDAASCTASLCCLAAACPPNSSPVGDCNCNDGYSGIPDWETATFTWKHTCTAVPCPPNSNTAGVCNCDDGYQGTPNWLNGAWTHTCVVATCPANSSPPGTCSCYDGYQGAPSWDGSQQKWTHICTAVSCPSNSSPPGGCFCDNGYVGNPIWDSLLTSWTHTCTLASCPSNSSPPATCNCDRGYQGTPNWEGHQQVWLHSCTAATCPSNSSPPSRCLCNTGYTGIPNWDGSQQTWVHKCTAALCPSNSSPPGTCNCDSGYSGTPSWDGIGNWNHNCVAAACPANSSPPGTCSCDKGYSGTPNWGNNPGSWTHSCTLTTCPSNSSPPGTCNCDIGYQGVPNWDGSQQTWVHNCAAALCPSNSSPPGTCSCDKGYSGTPNWDNNPGSWTHSCTPTACPSNSSPPGTCNCDIGYQGTPNWDGLQQTWSHICTAAPCPSNSSPTGSCICEVNYIGTPQWDIVNQVWTHSCLSVFPPSATVTQPEIAPETSTETAAGPDAATSTVTQLPIDSDPVTQTAKVDEISQTTYWSLISPGDLAIYTIEPFDKNFYDVIFGGLPITNDNKYHNYEHYLSSTLSLSCGKTGLSTKCLSNGFLRTEVAESCEAKSVLDDSLVGEVRSLLSIKWVPSCLTKPTRPGVSFFDAWFPSSSVVSVSWEGYTSRVVVQSGSFLNAGQHAQDVYLRATRNLGNSAYSGCFIDESVTSNPVGPSTGCRLQVQLPSITTPFTVHNIAVLLGVPHSHITHWVHSDTSNTLSFYIRSSLGEVSSAALCASAKTKLSQTSALSIMTAEVLKEELQWHEVTVYTKDVITKSELIEILSVSEDEVTSVISIREDGAGCDLFRTVFYFQSMQHSVDFAKQKLLSRYCSASSKLVGERFFFKAKSVLQDTLPPGKETVSSLLQISPSDMNYFNNGEFSTYVRLPVNEGMESRDRFVEVVRSKLQSIPNVLQRSVGVSSLSNIEVSLIVACEVIDDDGSTCPPSFDPIASSLPNDNNTYDPLIPTIVITAAAVAIALVSAGLYLRRLPQKEMSDISFESLDSNTTPLVSEKGYV